MGRHSKPSTTGRRIAQAALVVTAIPVVAGVTAGAASADILDEIERCESGGNPRAQNPSSSASGRYQFIDSTWRAYRGDSDAARAKDATPAEQEAAARRLLAAEGTAPWNASKGCWGGSGASQAPSRAAGGEPRAAAKPQPKPKAATQRPAPQREAAVRAPSRPAVPAVPAAARFTPGGGGTYTVQAGDTLSHLAAKHGTTVPRLMELNRGVLEMPDWVFEGEKIHLR